ncbi:MAG: YncE family protein [Candidatus Eiseniibacteriota bacterium]
MKNHRFAVTFLLLLAGVSSAMGSNAPRFKVAHRAVLGGEDRWDLLALDATTGRLFISRSTRVQVMDVKTDSVLGEIADTPGVHGVALAPELHRGFTSNGRDSSVTVFDPGTLAIKGRVKLPARNPDAIEYDPVSRRVFAFCGGSAVAIAIDATTDSIVGSVPMNGKPELAAADGKGRMYANLEDSSTVVAFDTRSLQVLGRWPLAPGAEPTGLAIDREHRRVFASCANQQLIVLDADRGRVVSVVPIGAGVDGVAFDPARQLIFSSNGDGTLTVIHEDAPDRYTVVENAVTQPGARTLALDPKSGDVFLPAAEFGPPPPPTADRPHPRGSVKPGTFVILTVRE